MDKIISKAVDGGYMPGSAIEYAGTNTSKDGWSVWNMESGSSFCQAHYQTFCDPLFWQALSKSCGWSKNDHGFEFTPGGIKIPVFYGNTWKKNALNFHEINLTQGFDYAVAYLQELISN